MKRQMEIDGTGSAKWEELGTSPFRMVNGMATKKLWKPTPDGPQMELNDSLGDRKRSYKARKLEGWSQETITKW